MNRSDRLIELIQILRDGALHRAEDMAQQLGVTPRTIYRDMETLTRSGMPVKGARGSGYFLTAAITLPPLNLTMAELEALHHGLAIVGDIGDAELKAGAKSLSGKIDAALPEDRSAPPTGWGFAVYPFADAAAGFRHMPGVRSAIRARQKLDLRYTDLEGVETRRTVRPLKMDYLGRVWTLTAWCETADAFAVFRIDRIQSLSVLPGLFVDETGKTLADYTGKTA